MSTDVPPPHHTPEYLAEDLKDAIIGVCIAVTIISTAFICARVFTRAKLVGGMQWDDWIVVASGVCEWICVGLAIEAALRGNGRHFDVLSDSEKEGALLFTMLNFPFGIAAFSLPKIAVVILLCRLMNPGRWHKILLWALSVSCFFVLTGCTIILFAQCSPSRSQWDFSITDKKCWNPWILVWYATAAGSYSAFTDFYLALYPAFVLWGLQMNLRKKIALSVALGIGSIATVVAIYKCTRLPSLASPDFTYDTADLVIWTVVEGSTIIVACCIPLLQPLLDLMLGRRTLNSSQGYKHYGSSRSGQHRSDIELSANKGRSNVSTVSRIHGGRKFDDTVVDDRAEVESQDSILRMSMGNDPNALPMMGERNMPDEGDCGILRTDVVTVSYDNRSTTSDAKFKKWGRPPV